MRCEHVYCKIYTGLWNAQVLLINSLCKHICLCEAWTFKTLAWMHRYSSFYIYFWAIRTKRLNLLWKFNRLNSVGHLWLAGMSYQFRRKATKPRRWLPLCLTGSLACYQMLAYSSVCFFLRLILQTIQISQPLCHNTVNNCFSKCQHYLAGSERRGKNSLTRECIRMQEERWDEKVVSGTKSKSDSPKKKKSE